MKSSPSSDKLKPQPAADNSRGALQRGDGHVSVLGIKETHTYRHHQQNE
jgi:hypothetical protein